MNGKPLHQGIHCTRVSDLQRQIAAKVSYHHSSPIMITLSGALLSTNIKITYHGSVRSPTVCLIVFGHAIPDEVMTCGRLLGRDSW